jgi:hypothetical protein
MMVVMSTGKNVSKKRDIKTKAMKPNHINFGPLVEKT